MTEEGHWAPSHGNEDIESGGDAIRVVFVEVGEVVRLGVQVEKSIVEGEEEHFLILVVPIKALW